MLIITVQFLHSNRQAFLLRTDGENSTVRMLKSGKVKVVPSDSIFTVSVS